jgi:lysylphosphatidylglycerol synthetase-like protein (DUF2156 family)
MPLPLLPVDPVEIAVPLGGRVLVVSDLHLGPGGVPPGGPVGRLTEALGSWTGPGVLVLNGNTFDPGGDGLGACLSANQELVDAVTAWASQPGRSVLALPGDRDAGVGWSEEERERLRRTLGAQVAGALDLVVDTGTGPQRIRVEPGQDLDPLSAASEATDTPLAHHLRREVIPAVRSAQGAGRHANRDWLDGVERLDDPGAFPRFVASRLTYRTLGRRAWLLAVPLAVAVAYRLPEILVARAAGMTRGARPQPIVLALAVLAELVLLAGLAVGALRRTWRAMSGLSLGASTEEPNRAGRDRARTLIAAGYRGLVSGHTCRPELTDLDVGFYANSGCVAEVVTECPARISGLGLPPSYLGRSQTSWVEIDAGADVHVRLLVSRSDGIGAGLLERLATRVPEPVGPSSGRPDVVAVHPAGGSWPPRPSGQLRKRRVRRLAGAVVALSGFVSLVAALSEPVRDRLDVVREYVPIVVPEAAAAVTAVSGLALLVLARGVRRGQRRAWAVTLVLLAVTAVSHLVRGVDAGEAIIALVVAAFLWTNRREFNAASDRPPLRGGLARWAALVAATVAAGTIGIELGVAIRRVAEHLGHHVTVTVDYGISWPNAALATVERMAGIDHVPLPTAIDRFYGPALGAATASLVLYLGVLLLRPVGRRRLSVASQGGDLARARRVVERHGTGTLDYFSLRSDKQHFFWGDTVVAYAVYGGVCLVSPDPIGPPTEREPAWRAFRAFVDGNGWALGGLGVGAEWLPIYRATGMHDLYVGDEGVVRIPSFCLEGGRFKGLRQAVNRVARNGYTISFHDPSRLDPQLRSELGEVLTKSRRGDVERGFSMTLGRVFDPADTGLLLAVVHGPSPEGSDTPGKPVAFCQFVPAAGIGGYSLDLMRRDGGEHPNGLIDFAVVKTIEHLRELGAGGLGLNFATMRAVLAGEAGDGPAQRIQAWLLRRMSDSMQIESLWRFNAKFAPDWQPRYVVYDAPENALAVAIAIARAESFWELPVIGRFLVPAPNDVTGVAESASVSA